MLLLLLLLLIQFDASYLPRPTCLVRWPDLTNADDHGVCKCAETRRTWDVEGAALVCAALHRYYMHACCVCWSLLIPSQYRAYAASEKSHHRSSLARQFGERTLADTAPSRAGQYLRTTLNLSILCRITVPYRSVAYPCPGMASRHAGLECNQGGIIQPRGGSSLWCPCPSRLARLSSLTEFSGVDAAL
ncbi:hypothetical protein BKA64DRAFT_432528 [Cadophora sp. MPI-SDFR-AT-0126]|nr:hypothetical protein BKA64DRAFT_432528 [Leotiomycetes sp. MPI-SDFR-AT-0126]